MPILIIQPNEAQSKDASFIMNGSTTVDDISMRVGSQPNGFAYRSAIQFDLSNLPVGSIISRATVDLTLQGQHDARAVPIGVHEIQEAWDEGTITWFSQPKFNNTEEYTFYTWVGVHAINITNLVQAWSFGTKENNGILLKIPSNTGISETTPETIKLFASSAASAISDRPKLTIEYNVPPTVPVLISPNGGELFSKDETLSWTASTDFEGRPVTYQVQISPDNGLNWKTILSNISALSASYNFISEVETSRAKIRVRAYDGEAYSQWDESNGVFTIQHNVAPSIPTILSPKGIPVDRLRMTRLMWQHNDSPNDIQSKADIQWRPQSEIIWRAITSEGPEQAYYVPPNAFPYGQNEWRVRTYDSVGVVSPWSNIAVFTAGDAANVPTIIQPSSGVNDARPLIEWTSASQSSYQIIVEDTLGAVVWDTGEIVSTIRARTVGVDLLNGGTYKVKVRVKEGGGLFSSFAERTFLVSYTPPAKPIVNTFEADGFVAFNIGTPTPTGTQPSVESYEIYKRINDVWTRIAYGVGSSFNDYHVRSGVTYEYYVKAIALNGTTSNSEIVTQSTTFRGSWINTLQDAEASLQYFRYNGTGYETYYEPESAVMKFAGRTRPVVHFGSYEEFTLTVRIQSVEGMSDMDVLRRFVRDRETVCYRDADGNLIVGHILALSVEKEYRVSSATITIVESDFNEGV